MLNVKRFTFNMFQAHTSVVWKSGPGCVVIDPGCSDDSERSLLSGFIDSMSLKPEAILLTHGHWDHVVGVRFLQDRYGTPAYMSPSDDCVIEYNGVIARGTGIKDAEAFKYEGIGDGRTVCAAGITFRVISTPGHTPGGVCFLDEEDKAMFTGDTLFAGTIGRTDLAYGEYDDIIVSVMEKLIVLDGDIVIYPGHGPASDIATERTTNPMLEPFNEPEESLDAGDDKD